MYTGYTVSELASLSYQITKGDLRAGDVLISVPENNVVLFGSWANKSKTQYWAYQ